MDSFLSLSKLVAPTEKPSIFISATPLQLLFLPFWLCNCLRVTHLRWVYDCLKDFPFPFCREMTFNRSRSHWRSLDSLWWNYTTWKQHVFIRFIIITKINETENIRIGGCTAQPPKPCQTAVHSPKASFIKDNLKDWTQRIRHVMFFMTQLSLLKAFKYYFNYSETAWQKNKMEWHEDLVDIQRGVGSTKQLNCDCKQVNNNGRTIMTFWCLRFPLNGTTSTKIHNFY